MAHNESANLKIVENMVVVIKNVNVTVCGPFGSMEWRKKCIWPNCSNNPTLGM